MESVDCMCLPFRVLRRPSHLGRRLILPQTFINDLPQQIVVGPGEVFDLGDELGPDPMHAVEQQG